MNSNNQETGLQLMGTENPSFNVVEFAEVAKPTNYHFRGKKDIPKELIDGVFKNKPFAGMNFTQLDSSFKSLTPESFALLGDAFMEREFFFLKEMGISFSKPAAESSKDLIEKNLQIYRANKMSGQVTSLEMEYKSLCALSTIFEFVQKSIGDEKFDNTHISLLQAINEVFRSLEMGNRTFVLDSLAQICAWNGLRGKYRTPTALSVKYLPELFMSCPVWFVHGKDIVDNTAAGDPHPDESVKFFSDLVGTQNFAWLYQMYNRRTRTLDKFKGPDIVPPHVIENLPALKRMFDYVVIARPYHDTASKEWADPAWHNNLDPYLLGFKKELPYAIMIERWSGTGLFPNMPDMIADTVNHIKTNINLLSNFSPSTYWYKGADRNSLLGNKLKGFAQKLLTGFDQGTLFETLRSDLL